MTPRVTIARNQRAWTAEVELDTRHGPLAWSVSVPVAAVARVVDLDLVDETGPRVAGLAALELCRALMAPGDRLRVGGRAGVGRRRRRIL